MLLAGFGAFGKMPSTGDFFRTGAPQGFVTPWDRWLQVAMLSCQQRYGEEWDGLFMSAPIWRFSLSAGQAGPKPVMGVLMPSVDRVGRRFPLTLVAPMDEDVPVVSSHFREAALFAALEDVALDALEDDMTRERLEERLASVPAPSPRQSGVLRQAGKTLVLSQGTGLDGVAGDMVAGLSGHDFPNPSIWSTEVDGVPRALLCQGLPQDRDVHALMNLHARIWSEARPI